MEPSRRKQTPKRPQAPQPVLQKVEGTGPVPQKVEGAEAVLQKVEGTAVVLQKVESTAPAMGPWRRPVLETWGAEAPLRLSLRPLQPLAPLVRNLTRSRCPCLGRPRWRVVREGLRTKRFSPAEN